MADICVWRNKAEGCLVSCVDGRIWQKVGLAVLHGRIWLVG